MRVVFEKRELINAISTVGKVIKRINIIPALECVLIDVKENIIFTSSNSDSFFRYKAEGKIIEEGSVLVEKDLFLNIIRSLPEDREVELFLNKKEGQTSFLNIISGNINQTIKIRKVEEFPKIPESKEENKISIKDIVLKSIINKTIVSVYKKTDAKFAQGLFIEINKDNIIFKSLDELRFSLVKEELTKEYEKSQIIIDYEIMDNISKICSSNPDDVINIYMQENIVIFEIRNRQLITTNLSGNFLDEKPLLKAVNDYSTKIKLNRIELIEALRRSENFVRPNDKKPVIFEIKNEVLNMSIETEDGDFKEPLNIQKTGNDLIVGFDAKLIEEILAIIEEEDVEIYFSHSSAPCFIKDKKEKYLYMISTFNAVRK